MDNNIRRVGIIIPPGNVAVEREFPLYLPQGVMLHFNRLVRPNAVQSSESILAMNESLEQVALGVAQVHPELIAFACTGASFISSPTLGQDLSQRITGATGIPSVVTSVVVVEALRRVGASGVFLIAPYPPAIIEDELAYLRHFGFDVQGHFTFNCTTSEANRELASTDVYEAAMNHKEQIRRAGALFVSCTNILVMDQIERMEADLGVPVVNSNQATLWAILDKMGLKDNGAGAGNLFRLAA